MLAITFLRPVRVDKHVLFDQLKFFQQFSGLQPSLFMEFYNNMNLMQENMDNVDFASQCLYKGVNALEELMLYADDSYNYDITEVLVIGERAILEEALRTGQSFYPKYLNSRII